MMPPQIGVQMSYMTKLIFSTLNFNNSRNASFILKTFFIATKDIKISEKKPWLGFIKEVKKEK